MKITYKKKREAREAKESDKMSDHKVFCMDLESVLLSPKSNVLSSYFKTKLIIHNFTIFFTWKPKTDIVLSGTSQVEVLVQMITYP